MTGSASPSPASNAWQRDLALIVLPALAVFGYCLYDPTMFNDGDANWHVAAGRWMLAHGSVPHTDPFSYTAAGRPWVAHEWLSEVLMAPAYAWAGWSGVMLLIGAAAALAIGLMAAELVRWLGTLSVIASLGVSLVLLSPHLLARPHVIALPVLTLWMIGLLQARRRNTIPSLWLLPLMVLWANLHGSYVFGLAVTCPFALEAFLDAPRGRLMVAVRWGGFLILAVLAATLTPNGPGGLIHPFELMRMTTLNQIGEWKPAEFSKPTMLEFALMFTGFVCLYRGVKMSWLRAAVLLGLLYMSLSHIRQEIVLAVVGPLLLAEPLGQALGPRLVPVAASAPPDRTAKNRASAAPWRELAAPIAVIAALFLGLTVWRLVRPIEREDNVATPVAALAHVPATLAVQPVFNDYAFGGWLILNGVKPFIDGRNDMYGDDMVRQYLDVDSDAVPAVSDAVLRRYRVAWTILRPDSKLVQRLDATPGWRRLYADKWAVVQVKDGALPPAAPAGQR